MGLETLQKQPALTVMEENMKEMIFSGGPVGTPEDPLGGVDR